VLQRAEDKRLGAPTAKRITKTSLCATYITNYMTKLNPIANAYGTTSGNKSVKELPFRGRTCFFREYKMHCLSEGYQETNVPSINVFKRAFNGVLKNDQTTELRFLRCKGKTLSASNKLIVIISASMFLQVHTLLVKFASMQPKY
jgi:hypothetical protein